MDAHAPMHHTLNRPHSLIGLLACDEPELVIASQMGFPLVLTFDMFTPGLDADCIFIPGCILDVSRSIDCRYVAQIIIEYKPMKSE